MTEEELQKQKERLEAIFDLTAHPGWKDFQADLQEAIDNYSNIATIPDEKALFVSQGRLQILHNILNTRDITLHHLREVEKQLAGDGPQDVSLVDDLEGEGHEEF